MLAEGVYTLQYYILLVLAVGALALEGWALVDALRHSSGAYKAAGKLSKPIWLAILGVATALGVLSLPFGRSGGSPLGFLSILGVVAAAVYLTDVRPAVRQMRGRGSGGRNSGPYGPW